MRNLANWSQVGKKPQLARQSSLHEPAVYVLTAGSGSALRFSDFWRQRFLLFSSGGESFDDIKRYRDKKDRDC